jgi:prepilin-type N-terminal cleavage/methylation domain-containing protein
MISKGNRGFTLIELLVVISIIGLLSSVVLASLKSARDRNRDAAVRAQMIQFRNLLILDYDSTSPNTYANLQKGWIFSLADCDTLFLSSSSNTNIARANTICKNLYNLSGNDPTQSGGTWATGRFYSGIGSGALTTHFSIMVFLPYAQKWQCMGVSGVSQTDFGTWAPAGCFSNP